jgi:hypothetical protein
MIPFETLIELCEIAFEPWANFAPVFRAQPATASSVELIQKTLGITLPSCFIELSRLCPSYGGWFASIGEDCDDTIIGILQVNRVFHDININEGSALAANLVLLNHGHDGDCDCWDLSAQQNGNEYPIVFCNVESITPVTKLLALTFHEYVERLCRSYAPRNPDKGRSDRARELLAPYVDLVDK